MPRACSECSRLPPDAVVGLVPFSSALAPTSRQRFCTFRLASLQLSTAVFKSLIAAINARSKPNWSGHCGELNVLSNVCSSVPIVSPLDSFIIYSDNWFLDADGDGFDMSTKGEDDRASLAVSFYGTAIFLEASIYTSVSWSTKEAGRKADRFHYPIRQTTQRCWIMLQLIAT
jgi:hypothetical protein